MCVGYDILVAHVLQWKVNSKLVRSMTKWPPRQTCVPATAKPSVKHQLDKQRSPRLLIFGPMLRYKDSQME